ncbi:MAG: hypothetical protein JO069_11600 [Verrucomicrobia bacterium]|nr:hypothetical protein [Verrucomicrobiota bacterium]
MRAPDGPAEGGALPEPGVPLVVGLDGVSVYGKDQRPWTEGWCEVIVGKPLATEDQAAQCFGFVRSPSGVAPVFSTLQD